MFHLLYYKITASHRYLTTITLYIPLSKLNIQSSSTTTACIFRIVGHSWSQYQSHDAPTERDLTDKSFNYIQHSNTSRYKKDIKFWSQNQLNIHFFFWCHKVIVPGQNHLHQQHEGQQQGPRRAAEFKSCTTSEAEKKKQPLSRGGRVLPGADAKALAESRRGLCGARWRGPMICSAGISGVTPDYTQQISFFFSISIKVAEGGKKWEEVTDVQARLVKVLT